MKKSHAGVKRVLACLVAVILFSNANASVLASYPEQSGAFSRLKEVTVKAASAPLLENGRTVSANGSEIGRRGTVSANGSVSAARIAETDLSGGIGSEAPVSLMEGEHRSRDTVSSNGSESDRRDTVSSNGSESDRQDTVSSNGSESSSQDTVSSNGSESDSQDTVSSNGSVSGNTVSSNGSESGSQDTVSSNGNVSGNTVSSNGSVSGNTVSQNGINGFADAKSKNAASLLEQLTVQLKQEGVALPEGQNLDPEKPIRVEISFRIPVFGDNPDPDRDPAMFVSGGDYADFALPDVMNVSAASADLVFNTAGVNVTVGSVDITNNSSTGTTAKNAHVLFSDELDDPLNDGVYAGFAFSMQYDLNSSDNATPGLHSFTLLGETFQVEVREKGTDLTMAKSGEEVIKEKAVKWKVRVDARVEGSETEDQLAGYVFEDDLSRVGELIPGSVKIGKQENGNGAVAVKKQEEGGTALPTVAEDTGTYSYDDKSQLSVVFSDTMSGTRYLFFETAIPDNQYYKNGDYTISNAAKVTKDGEPVAQDTCDVKYKMQWLTKEGRVENEGGDDKYNSTDRKIIWTIIANYNGATLPKAVITDPIDSKLQFTKAELYLWDETAKNWKSTAEKTFNTLPAGGKFELGDINTKVKLEISTKVLSNEMQTQTETISNSAVLTWENNGDGTRAAGQVVIGFPSIVKTPGTYDPKELTQKWFVKVDTKQQSFGDGLRTAELLIYGSEKDFSKEAVTQFAKEGDMLQTLPEQDTSSLMKIDKTVLGKLTPRYHQKYSAGSFEGEGLEMSVYHLYSGGKAIADLLVVTQDDGTGLSVTKASSYQFDTQILNPDYFAGVLTHTVENTVTLLEHSDKLSASDAKKSISAHLLQKDALTREGRAALESALKSGAGEVNAVNGYYSTNGNALFDYQDKSVIYRLHINLDGIPNLTEKDTVTGADDMAGTALGALEFTDTLPAGWKFQPIGGSDFLCYQAANVGDTFERLQATGRVADPTAMTDRLSTRKGSTATGEETMTFHFDSLSGQYILLVKAAPTEETAKNYFGQNGNALQQTNTFTAENGKLKEKPEKKQMVQISHSLLTKQADRTYTGDGYLIWQVVYNPYELAQGQTAAIEDTLPPGIELRRHADGSLNYEGNFTLTEMTLKADGELEEGAAVTVDSQQVFYDASARKLICRIPDAAKAYRFSYITDITGEAGENVSNRVNLQVDEQITSVGSSDNYQIDERSAGAFLNRSAYILIHQKTAEGTPLAGTEFTLYAKDGVTIMREGITGGSGSLYMKGMPEGEYVLKQTGVPDGYTATERSFTVTVKQDPDTHKPTAVITVTSDKEITLTAGKAGVAGKLRIGKTVTGPDADMDRIFAFDITLVKNGSPVAGTFDYVGEGGKPDGDLAFDSEGRASVGLKADQSICLENVPGGAHYTVKERNENTAGYWAVSGPERQGDITIDATSEEKIENQYRVGELTISKKLVNSAAAPSGKAFSVKLSWDWDTSAGAEGDVQSRTFYCKQGGTDKKIANGDTILLKGGESVSIRDIPAGVRFALTESTDSDPNFTAQTYDYFTVIQTGSNTLELVNIYAVGDLTVSKEVTGKQAPKGSSFTFTAQFIKPDGHEDGTAYPVTGGALTQIKSGDTFTLKSGESLTVKNLPAGTAYTVTEKDYRLEGYQTGVSNGTAAGSASSAKGVIATGETARAGFVNEWAVGGLRVSNTVTGNQGDPQKEFLYTLIFGGIPGAENIAFPYKGNGVADSTLKSGDTIRLKHGQSILFEGLPAGVTYEVRQKEAEGYLTKIEGAKGSVASGQTVIAAFVNNRDVPVNHNGGEGQGGGGSHGPSQISGSQAQNTGLQNAEKGKDSAPISTPRTGDDTPVGIWILLLAAALVLAGILLTVKAVGKRHEKKNR